MRCFSQGQLHGQSYAAQIATNSSSQTKVLDLPYLLWDAGTALRGFWSPWRCKVGLLALYLHQQVGEFLFTTVHSPRDFPILPAYISWKRGKSTLLTNTARLEKHTENPLSSSEEDSAFEISPNFVAQGELCVKLSPWHRVNLANSK